MLICSGRRLVKLMGTNLVWNTHIYNNKGQKVLIILRQVVGNAYSMNNNVCFIIALEGLSLQFEHSNKYILTPEILMDQIGCEGWRGLGSLEPFKCQSLQSTITRNVNGSQSQSKLNPVTFTFSCIGYSAIYLLQWSQSWIIGICLLNNIFRHINTMKFYQSNKVYFWPWLILISRYEILLFYLKMKSEWI